MAERVNWGSQLGFLRRSQLASQLVWRRWLGAYGSGPMVGQLASQQWLRSRRLTPSLYKGESTGQLEGWKKVLDPPVGPHLDDFEKDVSPPLGLLVAPLRSMKDLRSLARGRGPRPVTIAGAGAALLFAVQQWSVQRGVNEYAHGT